jgi:hypothetical protein
VTILLSRRGVLRCLTGIIAAPAVVKADALMRIVAPKVVIPDPAFIFRTSLPQAVWRPYNGGGLDFLQECAKIYASLFDQGNDFLALLPHSAAAHERAQGSVAAGQRCLR